MKKIIALLLACMMLIACTACAAKTEPAAPAEDAASTETAPAETPAAEEAAEEAPAAEEAAADSDLAYIQANGKLVIGITDFAPMDYQDENGEWIGFDADMAKAFAKSLGVEAEFVEIDWDNKIMELGAKTIDCVWNGMTLTDEVTSAMACSNAYCNNSQVVVVPAGKAADYQSVDACSSLNFAVESGSAGKATALMEVAAGTADAAVIDSLMAGAMVGEGTGYDSLTYTVSLNAEEGEQYGVGFRQGSDLAAMLNSFFAASFSSVIPQRNSTSSSLIFTTSAWASPHKICSFAASVVSQSGSLKFGSKVMSFPCSFAYSTHFFVAVRTGSSVRLRVPK